MAIWVSIVTGFLLEDRGSISDGHNIYSLYHNVQTGSGAHSGGTGGFSPGGKAVWP
jgi:hypothetical protein